HYFDPRLLMVFYRVLLNDEKARLVLKNNHIKAILVSHYIGLGSGPLSRVALKMKIPVYWKGGGHEIIALTVFNKLSQVYDYPRKPSKKLIDLLVKKYKKKVESEFNKFIDESIKLSRYGSFSVAYNNVLSSSVSKDKFLKKMQLKKKPIFFVMLHAFNDHPHSHFKKMLFNDYYDWFIQTFNFAKSDPSKNWIFKEHPANKFYPTKDLDFKEIMKSLPQHVKFVSRNSSIGASVVLNAADLIVTCLGTAGVEMPALRGIP
ncbi:unnamed protein product, partial [marine sediment metagenome]